MQFNDYREGSIFSAPFGAQNLTTGGNWDLFNLNSSGNRVQILDVTLQQITASTASIAIQGLGVQFLSGSTSTGTSGPTVTPQNQKRWSGAPTPVTGCFGPSSALASTASASLLYATCMNAADGNFRYRVAERYGVPIVMGTSQRLILRVTTPQVAITLFGQLTFKELGFGAPI